MLIGKIDWYFGMVRLYIPLEAKFEKQIRKYSRLLKKNHLTKQQIDRKNPQLLHIFHPKMKLQMCNI